MTRNDDDARCAPCARRRALLRGGGLAALAALGAAPALHAAGRDDPRRLPPQPDDELAFPSYENDGRALTPADVVAGAAPLLAYPRDAASGVIRERSRLNQILVLRPLPGAAEAAGQAVAAHGMLAFSGVCTHTACGVSEWDADQRHLVCPCHGSTFDPLAGGSRVSGPAPRALPTLPLRVVGERLVIAGPFSARVGAQA